MWSERDASLIYEMHSALAQIEALIDREARDDFLADKAKPHALAMFFVMLGEAASKVSPSCRARHPNIDWQRIANLRHLIAHEYRRVDHALLWGVATTDAPRLKLELPSPPPPETFA